MANSKLLKEAIADAKAVKETALANAKIALEEAFTPRLQSILTQKLRAEAEMEDNETDEVDEELDSSNIGSGNSQPILDADTDLSVGVKKDSGKPEQAGTDYKKVADISEEENPFGNDQMAGDDEKQNEIAQLKARLAELEDGDSEEENPFAAAEGEDEMGMDDMGMDSEMGDGEEYDVTGGEEEDTEDNMDLEAIIRELETQLGEEEEEGTEEEEGSMYENLADGSEAGTDKGETPKLVVTNEAEDEESKDDEKNEVIDLEEILREMESDMTGNDEEKEKEASNEVALNEAYKTIKSLQRTINEVNLLNAKLLFANKLFRAHNMTNEQKVKVIETLDRTKSVREVKLVYSTLAENFKYTTSSNKNAKKSISEGIASKVTKSTKPATAAKQVIAESADFSERFKKLAGIIK
jgi:hypothetical protein